ncbi:metallophosphoesterase family protein [Tuwongella immobilis]|uniref:Nuclease SbcCD subunit D n=1 Tax=Tuwongella immobilis TaxID=692036 RepID=A0A6C2YP56_9BACT|nr:DNA repair exonuclease [Tuwongella immobilis]VIP02662.1 exonuclease d subunit : Putative cell division topological specificity factor MinE OS=Capnocytophaga sp. oral taxon 380 str. F0488 GN=HMPREF9078_00399 PE=4 SV=1: Metallophos_2 [Tuwongella immobilis]VTS02075.1 exonuclease d subunit : Putative cell division topological specificity factor MinE OS=Capnocytophaga sp. oral taxon 380 str. F0488 GN=HMPREF9078_00399 PE=4 SV=1: Metallophos_2 [Tuwongella immobilis]
MRILHTADWHLNDRLGRIDRTDDLRKAVERIGELCTSESIDLLLIAGDLFSELARPDALRETIYHWQEVFGRFLAHGGTIVAITGNHDNENFCRTLTHAMQLAAPVPLELGAMLSPGRMHLATEPSLLRLRDPRESHAIQLVLMPYPTPTKYLGPDAPRRFGTLEEKNRLLQSAATTWLRDIRRHASFDRRNPSILMGHLNIRGAAVGQGLFRLTEQEDVLLEAADLGDDFAYVALGHIHKAQYLGGKKTVRYSGSIERMDLGEQHDAKGVVIFEMGASGIVGEPRVIPLPATPMYDVVIRNPAMELPVLEKLYPEAATALVNLHLIYTAGTDSLESILADLDRIFPRWYAREWQEANAVGASLVRESTPVMSFGQTVREYLDRELIQHDETERQAILALAESFIAQVQP